MAKAGRNLLDGKKRQASVLGSTLTSLTLNSESDSSSHYSDSEEEESETETESTHEEDANEDVDQKSGEDSDTKPNEKFSNNKTGGTVGGNGSKKQSGKESVKPKVRMKTLTIDGQLVYFCILCDKIFTRKKDKINHELAHSSETLISCPECGKDFLHESSLAHHIRSHDGEQLHFCDFCPRLFARSHQLKAHILLSHSNNSELRCKICRVDFKTTTDLHNHNRKEMKQEMSSLWCSMCKIFCCRIHCVEMSFNKIHSFRCSACNELFYTLKKLKLHAKKYAHKFNFNQPSKTVKEASDIDEINNDLKTEHVYKNVSAKRQIENSDQDDKPASKKSRTSDILNGDDHDLLLIDQPEINANSNVKLELNYSKKPCKSQRKPYCKKCNRSFKESSDLISHKLSMHCNTPGHSICRDCGQEFSSDTDLKRHDCKRKSHESLSHDGSENKMKKESVDDLRSEVFECHICSKTFHSHDRLQTHLRLHTNIKCFQCYLCQRNFVTKHYLQRHLQVHVKDGNVAQADKKGIKSKTSFHLSEKGSVQNDEKCTKFDIVMDTKHRFDNQDNSCLSDGSASTVITRVSDKSDAYQISSATSHSFKISMARERRKLRKRKFLSKSPMCKRLVAKKKLSTRELSDDKSIIFVDRVMEGDDIVNNFVVEINGAKSEVDQETTIFVELTLAKLVVPKDTSVLYSCNGIDKENEIPSCHIDNSNICNSENRNLDLCSKTYFQNFQNTPNHDLSNNGMMFDFDEQDFGPEIFSFFFDEDQSQSEPILKLLSQQLVPSYATDKFNSVKCDKSLETGLSSLLDNAIVLNPGNVLKNETLSLQPLRSLHLMTSKFKTEKEGTNVNVSKDSTGIRNKQNSKIERTNISHDSQNMNCIRPSSGKTCRDIAASWKSNKNYNNKCIAQTALCEPFKKPNSHHSNTFTSRFRIHSDSHKVNAVEIERTLNPESKYSNSELISSHIKGEPNASGFTSPFVNSSLPKSTSFSLHTSPSHMIKSELIDSHSEERYHQSSQPYLGHSASSVSTAFASNSLNVNNQNVKYNSYGSFSSASSVQSVPKTSQPNIFQIDTGNPALRDMNLMDMVCSIQTQQTASASNSVTQPGNDPSSTDPPNLKFEVKNEQQSPRNIKSELMHPLQVDIPPGNNSSRSFRNLVNSPRAIGCENSIPLPAMHFSANINVSLNLDPFNEIRMTNPAPTIFRHPLQHSGWPLPPPQQQLPPPPQQLQQGVPNLMNNAFPLLQQLPHGNYDMNRLDTLHFNSNNCPTYLGSFPDFTNPNASPFGLHNSSLPSGIINPIPQIPVLPPPLPTLPFGQSAVLPPAHVQHPPPPPLAMLPNTGVFYLPF